MKSISKLVIALATLGSCAVATAQPYGQADQERRERNREEAIAHYERMQRDAGDSRSMHGRSMHSTRDGTVREDARDAKDNVRSKTHDAAQSTRSFTHRQLNKVRNFGERQQRKYPNRPTEKTENKGETALGK